MVLSISDAIISGLLGSFQVDVKYVSMLSADF
jgi:hypothetical protein